NGTRKWRAATIGRRRRWRASPRWSQNDCVAKVRRHPEVRAKRASKDDELLNRYAQSLVKVRTTSADPSRAAELVIGPATSGRTRWRPPPADDQSAITSSPIFLC